MSYHEMWFTTNTNLINRFIRVYWLSLLIKSLEENDPWVDTRFACQSLQNVLTNSQPILIRNGQVTDWLGEKRNRNSKPRKNTLLKANDSDQEVESSGNHLYSDAFSFLYTGHISHRLCMNAMECVSARAVALASNRYSKCDLSIDLSFP